MNKQALKKYLETKLSEELVAGALAALGEPEKWDCKGTVSIGTFGSIVTGVVMSKVDGRTKPYTYGNLFETPELAVKVRDVRQKTNTIQAWVVAEQGSFEGEWTIYENQTNQWAVLRDTKPSLGTITMKKETAKKLADMLNKGLI